MKTTNYVTNRSNSSWLDTFLDTEKKKKQPQTCSKNSWWSIWAAWTDISKNDWTHNALMQLYINQSTKQVIYFSKSRPVIRNWMRGQIYVLVNAIPVLIICYKKFANKITMDLDINTFNQLETFASLVIVLNNIIYNISSPAFYYQIACTLKSYLQLPISAYI